MKQKSQSPSVLIGVGLLCFTSIGLAGVVYSFYQSDTVQEQVSPEDSLEMAKENDPLEQLKKEKNIIITPVPEQQGSGSTTLDTETGIPTGTYSNPPSTVESFDSSQPTSSPLNSLDSSVERNRLNQESLSNIAPDYSSPSSSNNFNNTSDNSLVEPLENDDFLDNFDTDPSEAVTTPSLSESSY